MAELRKRQKKATRDESGVRDPEQKTEEYSDVSAYFNKKSKRRSVNTLQKHGKQGDMVGLEREIGEPDSVFLKKENMSMLREVIEDKSELGLQFLLTSQRVMGDVMDVVAKPIFMMTNLADAGVHGVATGIRALRE